MSSKKSNAPTNAVCRRGAVIVELALISPFMAILILGMCEVAQSLRAETILTQAARKGCAAASRPGCSSADVISDVRHALAANGLRSDMATITILVNDRPADVASARRNDKVSILVNMPTSQASLTGTNMFMGSNSLQSEAMTMLKQG